MNLKKEIESRKEVTNIPPKSRIYQLCNNCIETWYPRHRRATSPLVGAKNSIQPIFIVSQFSLPFLINTYTSHNKKQKPKKQKMKKIEEKAPIIEAKSHSPNTTITNFT